MKHWQTRNRISLTTFLDYLYNCNTLDVYYIPYFIYNQLEVTKLLIASMHRDADVNDSASIQ